MVIPHMTSKSDRNLSHLGISFPIIFFSFQATLAAVFKAYDIEENYYELSYKLNILFVTNNFQSLTDSC